MRTRRVRPEDALRYLELALSAPLGSARRLQRLEQALLVYMLGKYWQTATIGDRRRNSGRPRRDDTEMLAAMRALSEKSGELRPYSLARIALGDQDRSSGSYAGRQRRLARAYCKAFPQTQ